MWCSPLVEMLEFMPLGHRISKLSLMVDSDIVIISFSLLTAPHMSVVVIGSILLSLACNKGIKIELMNIDGL